MKRIALIAWALGIGVVFVPQCVGKPVERVIEEPSVSGAYPSQTAAHNKQTTDSETAKAIIAVIEEIKKEHADADQTDADAETENKNIQRHLVEYTGLLVGVGLIQAIILVFTIWAIVNQTRANKSSQRGWVLVERIGNPREGWRYEQNSGYIPGIVFEFKVYGNTPVKVIDGAFDLVIVRNKEGAVPPSPDLPEEPDYKRAFRLPRMPKDGIAWAPSSVNQVRRSLAFTQEQVEMLNEYKVILCGYGYLKYRDAFGKIRETRVCYIYFLQRGGILKTPDGVVLNPEGFYIGGPPDWNKET